MSKKYRTSDFLSLVIYISKEMYGSERRYDGVYTKLITSLDYYRGTIKRSVKRSIDEGLLKNETDLSLTKEGKKRLLELFPTLRWYSQSWDKKWRLISYDIPESYREVRNSFRDWLVDYGFASVQSSVFISPFPVERLLKRKVEELNLGNFCTMFESKRLMGSSDKALASRLWKLESVNEYYKKMVGEMEQSEEIGSYRFEKALSVDKFLYKELLPDPWYFAKFLMMLQ